MRKISYIIIGIFFGIVMTKSEAISWYRIQEMFRFQAFHMYGIIGSALLLGVLLLQAIKYFDLKSFKGESIHLAPKESSIIRYLVGGFVLA